MLGRILLTVFVVVGLAFAINWMQGREPHSVGDAVESAANSTEDFVQDAANDIKRGL